MRYLILSDLHGNWDALEAVQQSQQQERFDATLLLGDLVGYGAEPDRVVTAVRQLPDPLYVVRGNHDRVVTDLSLASGFNPAARQAATWTADHLAASNLRYLEQLPRGPLAVDDQVAICHGSPLDEDDYLLSPRAAAEVFSGFAPRVTFFGHSHIASAFVLHPDGETVEGSKVSAGSLDLEPGHRYLFNPGSVGQPRDHDPRAAFMTFDGQAGVATWHRVEYSVGRAQQRIVAAGLPSILAERLELGV